MKTRSKFTCLWENRNTGLPEVGAHKRSQTLQIAVHLLA